jgi:hypothetical protein
MRLDALGHWDLARAAALRVLGPNLNDAMAEVEIRNRERHHFVVAEARINRNDQRSRQVGAAADALIKQRHLLAESREALAPVLGRPVNDRFPLARMKRALFEIAVRHGEVEHRSEEFQLSVDRGHRALPVAPGGLVGQVRFEVFEVRMLDPRQSHLPEIFAQACHPGFRRAKFTASGDLAAVYVFRLDQFLLLEYFRQVLECYFRRVETLGRFFLEPLVGGLRDLFQLVVGFFTGLGVALPLPDFAGDGMGRADFCDVAIVAIAPKYGSGARFHGGSTTDTTH